MSDAPPKVPDLRSYRCIGPVGLDVEAPDAESAAHIFQLVHDAAPVQVVGDGRGPVWLAGVCEHGGVHLRSSTRNASLSEPGTVGCEAETCRYADPELHRRNRVLAVLALTRRMTELCETVPEGSDPAEARMLLGAEHDIARSFVNLCSVSLSSQPVLPLAEGEICSGCEAPAIGRRIQDAVPLCWCCCQAEDADAYRFDPSAVAEVLAFVAAVLCALAPLDQPPFLQEAFRRLGLVDPLGWSEEHFERVLQYFDSTANGKGRKP